VTKRGATRKTRRTGAEATSTPSKTRRRTDGETPGSRERAIRAMARLLRRKGYAGTGLQDVVAEAGAPIGSLYHHFPGGKVVLAAEAVTHAGGELRERLASLLEATDAPGALEAIAAAMADDLRRSGWRNGCPIATTALERAADDEHIRHAADGVFRRWEELFAARLASDGYPGDEARALGTLAISTLEGALILARSQSSVAPLRDAAHSLAGLLRRSAPRRGRRITRSSRAGPRASRARPA